MDSRAEVTMARRRFEFDDGRSAKFWEIDVVGDRHTVRYGKLGTAGQTVEKQFAAAGDAKVSADKLIREKTRKGYREVTGAATKPRLSARRDRRATALGSEGEERPPRGPRLLGEAIYREAEAKGAKVIQRRELPKSVKRCPDFIAEFYQSIIWPRNEVFSATIGDDELDDISFAGPVQEVPSEILQGVVGCRGKDLFGVGSQQGGNKILLLDGNDKNKSDPTVYEVDHHPEPGDGLWKYCRLSKFLRCLKSEG
jgi:predicted DNA-binding WGR domain protein